VVSGSGKGFESVFSTALSGVGDSEFVGDPFDTSSFGTPLLPPTGSRTKLTWIPEPAASTGAGERQSRNAARAEPWRAKDTANGNIVVLRRC